MFNCCEGSRCVGFFNCEPDDDETSTKNGTTKSTTTAERPWTTESPWTTEKTHNNETTSTTVHQTESTTERSTTEPTKQTTATTPESISNSTSVTTPEPISNITEEQDNSTVIRYTTIKFITREYLTKLPADESSTEEEASGNLTNNTQLIGSSEVPTKQVAGQVKNSDFRFKSLYYMLYLPFATAMLSIF